MEYRKLKDIKLLDRNPRTIRDDDFKKLVQSIEANPDYFEARPLILSDRTGELVIIAGNQRYRAAKELKLKEVPTFLIKDLTEEREKEIIIRDNVSNGQWDFDILANEWEIDQLQDWGLDIPNWSNGLDVNNMTDDDVDLEDEFDPIGNATDLHKVIFIFDNEIEAGKYFDEKIKDLNYKKFGGGQGKQWQVNLSKTYGK